ncbi:MAG: PKD domain-containing protein [Muribaculaceae bacterium]|nr:PKD domain-containing protein [Muribaculaceae bacterium]
MAAALAIALWSCNSVDIITSGEGIDEPQEEWKRVEVEVLDYAPAPGQFVNILPEYTPGDSYDDITRKAAASLNVGREISLGAWGGSATLRLKTPVENIAGPDLRVCGNAILSGTDAAGQPYGSGEPGIVEVMRDENGNGLPDDTWYVLRGELYDEAVELTVIYSAEAGTDDITWTSADGLTGGTIPHIASFHKQPYFPQWLDGNCITVTGKRLPDNGVFNAATGKFDLYCLRGYADSFPDTDELSALDLDNAIDGEGRTVKLRSIDFVRVTTGVLQVNGPLGECSTEISGIEVPVF